MEALISHGKGSGEYSLLVATPLKQREKIDQGSPSHVFDSGKVLESETVFQTSTSQLVFMKQLVIKMHTCNSHGQWKFRDSY